MKINWGTSVVTAFALFIVFILFFVFRVQTNPKYTNDLVVEEYYKHDAHFQDELNKSQNAEDLENKPTIEKNEAGILISFPTTFNFKDITGKVSLYRSSNKKLDFEVPISLSNEALLIPKKSLVDGLWDITLQWHYAGKDFITTKKIYF